MTSPPELGLLVFASLAIALVVVPWFRDWAFRKGILDVPNERSSHTKPTPVGGGLVIVAVTLGGIVGWTLLHPDGPEASPWPFLLGAVLIATVSWIDDLRSCPRSLRFLNQSLVAGILITSYGYWTGIPLPLFGTLEVGGLGLVLTFLWVVGLTNAFNFMDGIDGIAGGQAIVAGLGWAAAGLFLQLPLVTVIGVLVVGTVLGFLRYNWAPAGIFMGDVGSAFLGYCFAALSVIAWQHEPKLVVAGALLVGPFVFDTTFTFFRRLMRGESVFSAHRSHLYQRLIICGRSHAEVSLLYACLATLCGLAGLTWLLADSPTLALLPVAVPALLGLLLYLFVRREEKRFSERERTAARKTSEPGPARVAEQSMPAPPKRSRVRLR